MKRNTRVRFLTEAAMIAAGYTVLTLLAMMLNLAYGPVQFRFSEALTVLPVLTPAAVPGLAVGCLLSNLWSSMAPLPPVLFNALIVGVEITIVSPGGFVFPAFLANALSVGLGELAVCYVLGLPLLVALEKAMGAYKNGRGVSH